MGKIVHFYDQTKTGFQSTHLISHTMSLPVEYLSYKKERLQTSLFISKHKKINLVKLRAYKKLLHEDEYGSSQNKK